jgi:hypothetical protein
LARAADGDANKGREAAAAALAMARVYDRLDESSDAPGSAS